MLSHSAFDWGNYDEIRKVFTERQILTFYELELLFFFT